VSTLCALEWTYHLPSLNLQSSLNPDKSLLLSARTYTNSRGESLKPGFVAVYKELNNNTTTTQQQQQQKQHPAAKKQERVFLQLENVTVCSVFCFE
jgi:hypothetical protein